MASVTVQTPRPKKRSRSIAGPVAGRGISPEFYFVKHIDNSRLRREVDRGKRRECFNLLGVAAVIFAFGFFMAWQHFKCVRFGYQIEELKAQRAALEDWNHRLRLEQASLADPQRIDALARKKLGLNFPHPEQVIHLDAPPNPAESETEYAQNFGTAGLHGSLR